MAVGEQQEDETKKGGERKESWVLHQSERGRREADKHGTQSFLYESREENKHTLSAPSRKQHAKVSATVNQ